MPKVASYPHIVSTPGTCGGRPRIEGHRIRVIDVAAWHEGQGLAPEEIATRYDLTLAEVFSALAYYFDHVEEIRADEAATDAFVREFRKKHPSVLKTRHRD